MTRGSDDNGNNREETEWIGEHFDSVACDHCEEYKRNGLSASSSQLIDLVKIGLAGRTLLDLGCGTGRFSIEALRKGASSCVGVDLSPRMVEIARQLAQENGLASKTDFRIGDAAREDHPESDIVVLDKVLCCYPEMGPLLSKAAAACREELGIVLPRDTGIVKIPLRVGVYFDNLLNRARRDPSRMYLHSLKRMNSLLVQFGFELRGKEKNGFWLVLVYRRERNRTISS